jgi:SAM-dependent methyltransferase
MHTPNLLPTKLNIGAGRKWSRPGWVNLDHNRLRPFSLPDEAWNLPWPDATFDAVFTSHTIEHISAFWIEKTFAEINRVMRPGGVLRIVTPDLEILCRAYLERRMETLRAFIAEDKGTGIREELGAAQIFLGFLYSPGYDNFLLDSSRGRLLGGYGHIFCFDYELLAGVLSRYGFTDIKRKNIGDSAIEDHRFLREVPYDNNEEYSLVVECRKQHHVAFQPDRNVLVNGPYPYDEVVGGRKYVLTRSALWVSSRLENGILWGMRTARDVLRRVGVLSENVHGSGHV